MKTALLSTSLLCATAASAADDRPIVTTEPGRDTTTQLGGITVTGETKPGEVSFDPRITVRPEGPSVGDFPLIDISGALQREYLYAGVWSGGVDVIDTKTKELTRVKTPSGSAITIVAVSEEAGRVLAGDPNLNAIYAIDLNTLEVVDAGSTPAVQADGTLGYPRSMAVAPGGKSLYVSMFNAPLAAIYDTSNLSAAPETLLTYYADGGDVTAFAPNSLDLYVGGFMSPNIGIRSPYLDLVSGAMMFDWSKVSVFLTGGGIQGTLGFAWLEKQGLFFAGNAQGDKLFMFDSASGDLVDTIDTAAMPMHLGAIAGKTDDEGYVYVPTGQSWTLDVFKVVGHGRAAHISLEKRLEDVCNSPGESVVDSPDEIVFSRRLPEAYVQCSHSIRVIDTNTFEQLAPIVDPEGTTTSLAIGEW